jgi:hypothetical protein
VLANAGLKDVGMDEYDVGRHVEVLIVRPEGELGARMWVVENADFLS